MSCYSRVQKKNQLIVYEHVLKFTEGKTCDARAGRWTTDVAGLMYSTSPK